MTNKTEWKIGDICKINEGRISTRYEILDLYEHKDFDVMQATLKRSDNPTKLLTWSVSDLYKVEHLSEFDKLEDDINSKGVETVRIYKQDNVQLYLKGGGVFSISAGWCEDTLDYKLEKESI